MLQYVFFRQLTGADFIPLGASLPSNAFDSHICFAAFQPVTMPDGVHRIYYMGSRATIPSRLVK